MNFTLKYGSKEHAKILQALRNRIDKADRAVSNKISDYADDEDRYMAYMKVSDADAILKDKRKDGDPQFVTINIPYSYAMLMSWHTYISSVFLSRNPVLQFMGRHGETEMQIQAVEAIMDYQTQVGGHLVPYYLWLLDAGKYGVGVLGNYWDTEYTQISEITEEQISYLGTPIAGKKKKVKTTRRVASYEGNRLFNVRPQDFIFDSRVSLLNFQQGEFCGRYCDLGWNHIVKRAEYGQYYNIQELKDHNKRKIAAAANAKRDLGSTNITLPDAVTGDNLGGFADLLTPDFSSLVELFVELIPADWGLGSSKYPEKWVFTVADDAVIIESQPYDCYHGKFPYSVFEYEMEAYGLQKRSMLEMLEPLNDTMTWLFNSHFYNVRQILNGQFIVDPSRITMKDFKGSDGGRLLRVKPTAYGHDVRSMISQLQTTDVTQNHIRDSQMVADLMQRVVGVNDNIMGMVNSGGRKTASEIRSSNSAGANRLKTQSEFLGAAGFSPLSQMLLQNTQQKYSGDKKFKLAGDLMEMGAEQFAVITPETIAGFYDFVPVDGTQPVDKFAQVTMWTQLMAQLKQSPEVGIQYDLAGIFAWVAQLGGLKNIKRFKIQVTPNGMAGGPGMMPIGGNLNVGGKGNAARAAGGRNAGNTTGVPGAAQLPGMGPTG